LDAVLHVGKIAGLRSCSSRVTLHDIVTAIAMAVQYSPLDLLLPFNAKLMDLVSCGSLSANFLPFCLLVDDIGRDRFQSLVLPHLQQFIAKEWQHNRPTLCLVVRRLSSAGLEFSTLNSPNSLADKRLIEGDILRTLSMDGHDPYLKDITKDAFAQFIEDLGLLKDSRVAAEYVEPFRLRILDVFNREGKVDVTETEFWTGRGFKTYFRIAQRTGKLDCTAWRAICKHPAPPTSNPIFLATLSEYLQALELNDADFSEAPTLLAFLINNLLSQAGEVITLSVRLMQHKMRQKEVQSLLSVILQIQEIPYGLQTVRQIAMLIRRLVVLQKNVHSDLLTQKIVPYFCLGLLSSNFAPVIQEVRSAIAAMCEYPMSEEVIADVLVEWLQAADKIQAPLDFDEDDAGPAPKLTRFQCSNIHKVKDLTQEFFSLFGQPKQNLAKMLLAETANSNIGQPLMTRLQALDVFSSIPHVAEKRSRFVVPAFLSMQPVQEHVSLHHDSAASASSHTMSPEIATCKWSFSERKAFLELLGKFKNPKVLFKSQAVFEALLESLTVSHSEIQKLALKALVTWKLASINKYEESLLKLTDEKTYRDELTILFQDDSESTFIQNQDRSQLVPILLRLLYGQMISRSRSGPDHGAQEAKRRTTLRMLFKLQGDEIAYFLDIAFGNLSVDLSVEGDLQADPGSVDVFSLEKQYGIVKTAESMLETLQSQLAPFGERILEPILYCLYQACRRLNGTNQTDNASQLEGKSSIVRNIRRTSIHCLCMLATCCVGIKWSVYLPSVFQNVIEPKLERFPIENAQGISGLLQLFATWASDARRVQYLTVYNESLLEKVAECLLTPSTRDDVKIYILDQIFLKLLQLAAQNSGLRQEIVSVLQPHVQHLLGVLGSLLENKEDRKVLDSAVSVLASLTPLVDSSIEVESLISAIAKLLGESAGRVSPKVKGNLLQAVLRLLKGGRLTVESSPGASLRQMISNLFNYFTDVQNRSALADVLQVLATGDSLASEIASICSRLNAVSNMKLDGLDYDSRLEAFSVINAKAVGDFIPELWEPIIQNLLYFARAADDFAIRSNAVSSLRRFILHASELRQPGFQPLLQNVVLESLRKATKADSESVRADHVALFGLLVQKYPEWADINDMRGLMAGDNEDASFFNNILHIQHHRRTRALRRLSAEAEQGVLRSTNICNFFIPLLEKFIFDQKDDEGVRNLRGQAIPTVGGLLQWVEWSQFRAIFKRYKSYMNSKTEAEKDITKLLGASADALVSSSFLDTADQYTNMQDGPLPGALKTLAKSLPSKERLSQELTTNFIPDLTAYVHQKDESQITSRIPIAITTVKLLKILPLVQMDQFLPPLLLDVAYVLRSRSQDSRDVARRTLAEVTSILGPSCIHWILKELRTALTRGYQVHVLSYTVHSILVSNVDRLNPGDLDHCLDGLVAVVMDDIFGTVGEEKSAENYISKMREVKSSKSFDSMELLAKSATVSHLFELLRPLQALLSGAITSKQSRQIDELLRRIGLGLLRNPAAASRDMLLFSYQIIEELYKERLPATEKTLTTDDWNRQRFLVQLSGPKRHHNSGACASSYKLAKFALDVVRLTLKKHSDLLQPENVHGFLPLLGDALVQAQEDVKISAIRLLSGIVKLPMPELEANAGLYIIEAVKVVKDSINTNSEAAQAALKLIAVILRERRCVHIRDSDLSYVLGRIIPDLEEPARQGVTFNFVKAVMGRTIMLPEVYDASKKIGTIMVTNHGQSVRDAARGIFVHFLIEFAQSKERWNKQLNFLVKNLSYQYAEGRQSVMEAIHVLLIKTGETIAQEVATKGFLPLVLIMANDDNAECRQMAGAVVSQCFQRAGRELQKSLLDSLRGWVQQSENPALSSAGMQAFKLLFDVPNAKAEKEVPALLSAIYDIFKDVARSESDETWETIHHALQLFSKIVGVYPAYSMTQQQAHLWFRIRALLTYPHPWIQSRAAAVSGAWFHELATANGECSLGSLPLVGSHGLELTADAQLEMLKSNLLVLRRNWSSKDLSAQTIRNLVFLGRCFSANELAIDSVAPSRISNGDNREDDEDHESDMGSDAHPEEKSLAISYLLTQLSAILRHEPRKLTTGALLPKQSSLQVLAALTQHTPTPTLLPLLPRTILPPLAHLTDPSLAIPISSTDANFSTTFRGLTTSASEVLDLLQKKVGSADYVKTMTEAQKLMRERREDRRVKRKMERVKDPEAAAREKRRRVEKEKRRKAEKREGFRRGRKGL
jgi:U3 small nucleolar RNA-associated protein 20